MHLYITMNNLKAPKAMSNMKVKASIPATTEYEMLYKVLSEAGHLRDMEIGAVRGSRRGLWIRFEGELSALSEAMADLSGRIFSIKEDE